MSEQQDVQAVRIRLADARAAPQPDLPGRSHLGYVEHLPARPFETILTDAVALLTEAGRLRRSTMRPTELGTEADGSPRVPRWEVDPDPTEQPDWAEFVTLALAGATANLGGIETALAERSGSWEASGVRSLLQSTVGPDENDLWRHRTEPLVITLYVEDLVNERTQMWEGYDAAEIEVQQMYADAEAANPPIDTEPYLWRYRGTVTREREDFTVGPWEPVDPAAPAWSIEAWRAANTFEDDESARHWERMFLGEEVAWGGHVHFEECYLPRTPELGEEYDRLVDEREARLGEVARLEEQRTREVAAYGEELRARVETAAQALPGLAVPVQVDVDLTWSSRLDRVADLPDLVERLIEQATLDTPAPQDLPGTPLSRLLDAQGHTDDGSRREE